MNTLKLVKRNENEIEENGENVVPGVAPQQALKNQSDINPSNFLSNEDFCKDFSKDFSYWLKKTENELDGGQFSQLKSELLQLVGKYTLQISMKKI